jgi:hypothetical protein
MNRHNPIARSLLVVSAAVLLTFAAGCSTQADQGNTSAASAAPAQADCKAAMDALLQAFDTLEGKA